MGSKYRKKLPGYLNRRGGRLAGHLFSLLLGMICFASLSCTPLGQNLNEQSAGEVLIKEVPFFPQQKYQCGPAALASVLNFWGKELTPEDIAREIYSPEAKGTLNIDLFFYAQRKGFQVQQYHGSLEDLKRNLSAGIPLIVQVDYGFLVYEQSHFMVVIGYNRQGVIVHSGLERAKFIPTSSFLSSWKKANHWTLRIIPQ